MAYFPKRYTAGLSKSGEKKQKASINKGKQAAKEGKKLPKSYFKDRQAIGGESLKEDEEQKPGEISSSKTADKVIKEKRREIKLGGKGEAGTGTVTVPKGTAKQQRKYEEVVRRRQGDPLQEKLDAQKAELQKSYSFGSRTPIDKVVYQRPGYEEEAESEDAPKSEPLMKEPSEAPTPEALGVEEGRTGKEMSEDYLKYQGDGPDEFAGLGPDGKPRYVRRPTDDGIDEPPPRPIDIPEDGDGAIDTAMDIYRGAAKNYPKNAPIEEQQGFAVAASKHDYMNMGYNDEQPVAVAQVEYDGRNGEVREYADGDRFFVSFQDGVIIRMRDRDSKSK